MYFKEIGPCAPYMITNLGLKINIIDVRTIWSLNEHYNIHFDNEQDIHMSFKFPEESGYGLGLDLLTFLY